MWVTDFGRDCHCGILNMVMVIEAIDLGRMFSVVNMQDVRMVLTLTGCMDYLWWTGQ